MGSERVDRPEERAGEEIRSTPTSRWPPIVQETGFLKPRRATLSQEVRLSDSEVDNLIDLIEAERQQRERGSNKLVFTLHSIILGDDGCLMGKEHTGSCWYRRPSNKWDNDYRKRLP